MPTKVRHQILLIEDDPALTRMLRAFLEMEGYAVRDVPSGAEGLKSVDAAPPELVILDLGLPDMDGFDVCRQLRRLFPAWDLPVVMLTGRDTPADQLRGFAHGADVYLTKPCEPSELLRAMALLLGEKPSEDEEQLLWES
jgi:two-component system OmpR family response regulator/two-component system response regulator RstA